MSGDLDDFFDRLFAPRPIQFVLKPQPNYGSMLPKPLSRDARSIMPKPINKAADKRRQKQRAAKAARRITKGQHHG